MESFKADSVLRRMSGFDDSQFNLETYPFSVTEKGLDLGHFLENYLDVS
jgi:hypothetical protein